MPHHLRHKETLFSSSLRWNKMGSEWGKIDGNKSVAACPWLNRLTQRVEMDIWCVEWEKERKMMNIIRNRKHTLAPRCVSILCLALICIHQKYDGKNVYAHYIWMEIAEWGIMCIQQRHTAVRKKCMEMEDWWENESERAKTSRHTDSCLFGVLC